MSIVQKLVPFKPIDPMKIEEARKKRDYKLTDQMPSPFKSTPQKPSKEWTVLFYMDGNNNLQGLTTSTFRQLEKAGSSDDVNVVAQLSRNKHWYDFIFKDWSGARRYYVEKNPKPSNQLEEMLHWRFPPFTGNIKSPVLEKLGEVDMGDPVSLENFIIWGIKNYPAEKFMLVLMNHGAGFMGSMHDEKSKSIISNDELAKVLENVYRKTGVKVDILAFDACLMGQSEVAYELKDKAKILIGSEENEAGAATPYEPILKDLQKGALGAKEISPEELAKLYVYEAKVQPGSSLFTPTQSAVDLSKMDYVKASSDRLAKALFESKIDRLTMQDIIKKTQHYCNAIDYKPYTDYRDLYHFAEVLLKDERIKDLNVKEAAKEAMQAVKSAVIAEEHVGSPVRNSHGLSIYLPGNYGYDRAPVMHAPPTYSKTHHYEDTAWAKDTAWDEMLKKYSQDEKLYEILRNLGVSEEVIDKTHAVLTELKKKFNFALGYAESVGAYEGRVAISSDKPKPFLGLSAEVAAKVGLAGGVVSVFKNAAQILKASKVAPEDGRTQKIVNASLDTATSIAITSACLALTLAKYLKLGTPAGIVSVAVPIAKTIYNIYMQMKEQKDMPKTNEEKIKALASGRKFPATAEGTLTEEIAYLLNR